MSCFFFGTNMIAINNFKLIQTPQGQEIFRILKNYLDTIVIQPNPDCGLSKYGIKQPDYFSDCYLNSPSGIQIDPYCEGFKSLTFLLLDHIPPSSTLGNEFNFFMNLINHIHSFFTIYDKGSHAEFYNFCGDKNKRGNKIGTFGMLEFLCSFESRLFFHNTVIQTFGTKKIWISVMLSNPIFAVLIKYYIRLGFYNEPQIYSKAPSSQELQDNIDERFITVGMWYDPLAPELPANVNEIIQNTVELADFVGVQKKIKDNVFFRILIRPEYVKRFRAFILLDRECGFPLEHKLITQEDQKDLDIDTVYVSPFFGQTIEYKKMGTYDPQFYPGDADLDDQENIIINNNERLLVSYHTDFDIQNKIGILDPLSTKSQEIINSLYASTPSKWNFFPPLKNNFSFHTHPMSVYRGLKINFPSDADITISLSNLQQFNFVFSLEGIWMYNLTNEIIKFYNLLFQKVSALSPDRAILYRSLILKDNNIMMNPLTIAYHNFLLKLYTLFIDPTPASDEEFAYPLIYKLFLNEAYVKSFLNLVIIPLLNKDALCEYIYLAFSKIIKVLNNNYSQEDDQFLASKCSDFTREGINCDDLFKKYTNMSEFMNIIIHFISHINSEDVIQTQKNIVFNGLCGHPKTAGDLEFVLTRTIITPYRARYD